MCGECSVSSGEVRFIGCVGRIGGVSFRVGIVRTVDMYFHEVRVRGQKLASWWVRSVCVFLCGLGLHMLVVCQGLPVYLGRVLVCLCHHCSLVLVCLDVRSHSRLSGC